MSHVYKRILILGNSGSGKSTLAQKMGAALSLPVYHLDHYFWGPNWEHPDDEIWRQRLMEFLSLEAWIIEGGVNNLEARVDAADLVIYIDFPTWFCLYRSIVRYFKFWLTPEPFLPKGCKNRLDWRFLRYIFTFNRIRAPLIRETLSKYENFRNIVIIKTSQDKREFDQIFLNNLIKRMHPHDDPKRLL